jgi:PAS domain-containing protein
VDASRDAYDGAALSFADPRTVLDVLSFGTWEWDPHSEKVGYDDRAAGILCLREHGQRLPLSRFLANLEPDNAADVAGAVLACAEHGTGVQAEIRVRSQEGAATWARLRAGALRRDDGSLLAVVGVVSDTADLHAQRQRVQHRFQDVSDGILALEHNWTISYANPTAGRLLSDEVPALLGCTLWEVLPEETDSPVWVNYHWAMKTQQPVTFETYSARLGGWFEVRAFPAAGGLTVYLRSVDAEHEAERQRLLLIQRLERALSRGRQLLELTEALSGQLSVQSVADTVTAHARRSLGVVFAGVALVEDAGQSMGYVSLDPLPAQTRSAWARVPLSLDAPVTTAARTRTAYFHESVTAAERDFPEIGTHMRRAGTSSVAHVPLEGSTGALLGTLALAWETPHTAGPEEREFIRTMTGYCAQALERAMLFEQQRTVADALQRAVLPDDLPRLDNWQLTARYVPATCGIEVGGDWYDAFELPDGRLGVAVGDASGHGLPAARVMSSLRNALRAYALLGEGPGPVLTRLDRLLARLDPDALATVVYLELEPGSGRGRWAAAGHPPPLWRLAGTDALESAADTDPPLGVVGPRAVSSHEVSFAPGDGVLLYTDGLIERPGENLDLGLDRLVRASRTAAGSDRSDGFVGWLDGVVSTLLGSEGARDDVCVLALRRRSASPWPPQEPAPSLQVVTRRLRPRAQAVREARHLAQRTLAAWRLSSAADTVSLVVSELVTNAVTHARSAMTFTLELTGAGVVRVAVTDSSRAMPEEQTPGPSEEHGRGIQLVELLSSAWGATVLADGKVVWAEVPVAVELP